MKINKFIGTEYFMHDVQIVCYKIYVFLIIWQLKIPLFTAVKLFQVIVNWFPYKFQITRLPRDE